MSDYIFSESGKISLRVLMKAAFGTLMTSRSTYKAIPRSLSLKRFARTLFPNVRAPIFVVGCPRSGTTFLGSCLSRLPELSFHMEPYASVMMNVPLANKAWGAAKANWFIRSYVSWLMRIHGDGDLVYIEKNPMNAVVMPYLLQAFPKAKFIHLLRDGRDVSVSLSRRAAMNNDFETYFIPEAERASYAKASLIRRCARSWRVMVESARNTGKSLPKEQYLEIKYEDIILSAKETSVGLLDFLGVENPESRQAFIRDVKRGKSTSINQWKDVLSDDELLELHEEITPLLAASGYDVN